mgnify:FL=1
MGPKINMSHTGLTNKIKTINKVKRIKPIKGNKTIGNNIVSHFLDAYCLSGDPKTLLKSKETKQKIESRQNKSVNINRKRDIQLPKGIDNISTDTLNATQILSAKTMKNAENSRVRSAYSVGRKRPR